MGRVEATITGKVPYKRYLVTRVETVTVSARSVSEAEFIGEQALDYFGAGTQDLEVEELGDGEEG